MTTTIRINEDTEYAINELGGTFDSPNDVVQRLIREAGHGELLEEDRETNVESGSQADPHERESRRNEKYIIKVYDGNRLLETFEQAGHGSQSKIMGAVAEYLVKEYNLINRVSPLPFVPRGKKALINDSPVRTDGDRMRTYEELDGGYYVDTHYDASGKIERLKDLVEACGLTLDPEGDW